MSVSFMLRMAPRSIVSCVLPAIRSLGGIQPPAASKNFHSICVTHTKMEPSLLQVSHAPLVNAVCGMKTKGQLNLRCKGCYFVVRKGRRYVMCKTHPRHKQQAMVKKEENTWILTHWTQGKRAWGRW